MKINTQICIVNHQNTNVKNNLLVNLLKKLKSQKVNLSFTITITSLVLMIVFLFLSFGAKDVIAKKSFVALSFISAVLAIKSSSKNIK